MYKIPFGESNFEAIRIEKYLYNNFKGLVNFPIKYVIIVAMLAEK